MGKKVPVNKGELVLEQFSVEFKKEKKKPKEIKTSKHNSQSK